MNEIVTRVRKYGGTFYAKLTPEIVELLDIKEGDIIGIAPTSLNGKRLKPLDDGE